MVRLDNTGIQQLLDQAHQKTVSSEDNTFLKHRESRRLGGQRSLTIFGVDWTGDVLPISGPGARPVPRQIRSLPSAALLQPRHGGMQTPPLPLPTVPMWSSTA
uniref:Uncharacterized protein n=1 Tax=Caenorhabditis japonica TaxID=281687 RepID=A0A8R1IRY9_CAEJA